MHTHPLRKGLVAVAAAVTLVLFLAAPASAVPEVTDGVLTVRTTPAQVFDFGPGDPGDPPPPEAPCPEKDSTLAFSFNTGAGTWSASGGFSGFFQLGNPPSGQWYQADFTLLSATGTYSGSSPYALTSSAPNHITARVQVYAVGTNDCLKDDLRCVLTGRMVMTSGSHTGSIPPATGDTTVFDATSNTTGGLPLAATSCQQPFSSMHGSHFDVDDLTFLH